MTRLILRFAATAVLASGFAVLPAPAMAQQGTGTLEVVVYGNDPCPRSTESQIVVCRRDKEENRYRLPKDQQLVGTRQQREAWARKSHDLMTVGNTGVGSCSAVGPGGREGCLVQDINRAKQESQEQQQGDQPPKL